MSEQWTFDWIDASKDFTPEFIRELEEGQVLGFDKDGKREYYKVVRLRKRRLTCWVRPVKAYKNRDGHLVVKE